MTASRFLLAEHGMKREGNGVDIGSQCVPRVEVPRELGELATLSVVAVVLARSSETVVTGRAGRLLASTGSS